MLYCLYHNNIISENGVPDYESRKTIGHYTSLRRALETIEKYRNIPGFAEFPYGFGVECIFQKDSSEPNKRIVYRNAYIDCSELDGIETYFEGYYASLDQAKMELQAIMSLPRFANAPDNFETCEIHVNMDQWTEGFTTE